MANDEVMRNLDAEKAVLGALMNEQVALKWADKLEPDDFSDADNRRLFIAISTAVSAKHSNSRCDSTIGSNCFSMSSAICLSWRRDSGNSG